MSEYLTGRVSIYCCRLYFVTTDHDTHIFEISQMMACLLEAFLWEQVSISFEIVPIKNIIPCARKKSHILLSLSVCWPPIYISCITHTLILRTNYFKKHWVNMVYLCTGFWGFLFKCSWYLTQNYICYICSTLIHIIGFYMLQCFMFNFLLTGC
jgi:hypothetical protein